MKQKITQIQLETMIDGFNAFDKLIKGYIEYCHKNKHPQFTSIERFGACDFTKITAWPGFVKANMSEYDCDYVFKIAQSRLYGDWDEEIKSAQSEEKAKQDSLIKENQKKYQDHLDGQEKASREMYEQLKAKFGDK